MTFKSADFKVTDNKGVISDSSGNKTLNAKVELNESCPFCGEKHVYCLSLPAHIKTGIFVNR
jgi:hypothetical protein